MSCNRFNFNITDNCSYLVYLNVANSDLTPINLSGFLARGKVKQFYGSDSIILDLNPQVISPYESGILMVSGSAASTSGIAKGSFWYDIEIYNSNGYALKVLNGDFCVYPTTFNI